MRELEPLTMDRDLRALAREIERRKASGESLTDALPEVLADEETLAWLRELRLKDPLAALLEGWLLRLREQVWFGPRRAELGQAHRIKLHAISEPERAQLPLTEMFSLSLTRARQRAAYLRGYFASASGLSDQIRRFSEERQIFAERLGAPLDSFEVAGPAIAPAARKFLADTRAAYETLQIKDPEGLVTTALAEAAHEGWPAHLSMRTATELLGNPAWFVGLRLRHFSPPQALGASSFLRALAQTGYALCDAASAQRLPFVLASDVFDLQRSSVGALLSALPASPSYATRQLGLGSSRVRDHLRPVAQAMLVDARVAAFRVLMRELLASGSNGLRRELPELSEGALGFELPLHVAGVFIRVRPRDSQRFAGALLAASQHDALRQTHDEDWFRNPRAIAEVRAQLGEPQVGGASAEALAAGASAFRAWIEPLL